MKITRELAKELIQESQSFRDYVIEILFDSVKDEVFKIISENSHSKIAAIKYIRELSMNRKSGFINTFGMDESHFGGYKYLTLKAAKELVERLGNW